MMLSVGTKLGPYEFLAPLGAGGMGEVYRARDPRIGREVAIKVLPASFSSDPDRLRRRSRQPPFGVPRVGVRGDPCRDRTPRCIGVCATRVNPTSGPQTHKAGSSPARLLLPRVAVMLLL